MRPKRIRCCCCFRLMAYEPYKRGDAIRRQPPHAGTCLDCKPRKLHERFEQVRNWQLQNGAQPYCSARGCEPASAIVKLASVVQR